MYVPESLKIHEAKMRDIKEEINKSTVRVKNPILPSQQIIELDSKSHNH